MIVTAFSKLYTKARRASRTPPISSAQEEMNLGILKRFFAYVILFCFIGSVFALAFIRGSSVEKEGFPLDGGLSPPQIPAVYFPLSLPTSETSTKEITGENGSPLIGEVLLWEQEQDEREEELLEEFWMQDYDEKHTLQRFVEEQRNQKTTE